MTFINLIFGMAKIQALALENFEIQKKFGFRR